MMWWHTVTFAAVLFQILMTTSTVSLLEKTVSSDSRNSRINYRLPTNVRPINYKITLDPLIEEGPDPPSNFTGLVEIRVKIMEDTVNITLHHNDITIVNVTIERLSTESYLSVSESYDPVTHFWVLSLDRPISAEEETERTFRRNEEYLITAHYNGILHEDMYGFYRSSYLYNDTRVWLLSTQFQPTHARRAFPCFDEPAFRATFDVSIKKKGTLHALSAMPIKIDDDDDYFNFETTPNMPTYLLAFVVSDFEYKNTTGNFHVWARKEAVDQLTYRAGVGPQLLDAMEKFLLGMKYQLPKLDEVSVPDFSAGAMENWGLTTYRERIILYDRDHSNRAAKQLNALVGSHEYAHKWFGNLVTPEWWNFLWLSEGMATYFEFFATRMVEKTWRLEELFVVQYLQAAFVTDSLLTSNPMTQPVDSPASVRSNFNIIAYQKAGSVIRMMEHFVTTPVFRQGLKRFLESRLYSSANEEHLYVAMNEEFRTTRPDLYRDVSLVMYSWTRQAGYPLLTVTSEGNELIITQNRFLFNRSAIPEEDGPLWVIPLTYTIQGGDINDTTTKHWMRTPSLRISRPAAANNWFIFNVQQTGYYRVNYDPSNWNLLINLLKSDNYRDIAPVNRAQLLDDALNLARAGVSQYGRALELAEYLEKEEDYVPWLSALNAFSFVNIRLTGTNTHEHFKNYLLRLIQPIYEKLQFEENPEDDDHVKKLHRGLILQWACNLGHEDCIATAKSKFQDLQNGTALPPDLQSVTYCVALREGGEEEWNFLWNRYVRTNYATEEHLILLALGCTTDQTLIDRYLNASIYDHNHIRRQDAASVFISVFTNNPGGIQHTLDFLNKNFESVQNAYGTGMINIINGLAARISTEEQLNQLVKLRQEQDLGVAADAADRAIETARENLHWSAERGSEIYSWLTGGDTDGASSLSLSPAVCMTLFFICLYQMLSTFKLK